MSDEFRIPVPRMPSMSKSREELNPAQWMHERVVRSIIDFEKKLDETKEVGARLVNFGPRETISIDDVGFWGPDLVIFYGRNADGNPVELLQHVTQINVLLVAVPIESDKPRRIGFILEHKLKPESEK